METATPKTSASRLARLRSRLSVAGLDALVVSNLTNVRYLIGFRGTAGVLVVTATDACLVVDFRYAVAARAAVAGSGVSVLVSPASIDDALVGVLKVAARRRVGIEAQSLSVARFNKLSAALADPSAESESPSAPFPTLVSTERLIERQRATKDAAEIALLREAGRRLGLIAVEIPAIAAVGRSELDVAVDIDRLVRTAGFERPAFETIVASGPNGALPHARPTSRMLELGDGVVLDFGGVYEGYCVDLTRTVQLGGPTGELARIDGCRCRGARGGHRGGQARRTVQRRRCGGA